MKAARIQTILVVTLLAACAAVAQRTNTTPRAPVAPQLDSAMRLTITPAKREAYVGEPIRIDIVWECDLPAGALKQFLFDPAIFYHPSIEVEVPRSTEPEAKQVGLPVGGRRIIARRDKPKGNDTTLGRISFSLFARSTEPDDFTFPPSRLQVSRMKKGQGRFAPYASYFNNSLFEVVEEGQESERIYAEAASFAMTVHPLPEEGRHAAFSGIFQPCRFETSIRPAKGRVGDLMELSVRVFTDVASRFLDLPYLGHQSGLRHHFWVDKDIRRVWQPDGAEFLVRFRPLTTSVRAFPPLTFQVFNPATGVYESIRTPSIPLEVMAQNGQTVFERSRLADGTSSLTDSSDGVWHNDRADRMNDVLNTMVNLLADSFWMWMVLAPVLFLIGLPLVRERRRLATDADYRRQVAAYKAFHGLREGDPSKWDAFRAFLAAVSGQSEQAYTVGDAVETLQRFDVDAEDMNAVRQLFESDDCAAFGDCTCPQQVPRLNALAKRTFQRIVKGTVMVALLTGLATGVRADSWAEAEQRFAAAHREEPGSTESVARFADAALTFETVARTGRRPGHAWYNAGNAWFQAGDLGRSIAAYLRAREHRPFDKRVRENLAAARALTADRVQEDKGHRWLIWPPRWVKAILVLTVAGFWLALACQLRYRTHGSVAALSIAAGMVILIAALLVVAVAAEGKRGVVIAEDIYARKGPGYSYAQAFLEPLHGGLECSRQEIRDEWCRIALPDGRECWIPASAISLP